MEHKADVTGLPNVDAREACAFPVGSDGAGIHDEGSAGKVFRRIPEDFGKLSLRDLLDPESPASRAAWAKLAKGEDFRGELRLRRGDGAMLRNGGGDGERVALLGGTLEIESRPGTTVKAEVHSRGDFRGGDGG